MNTSLSAISGWLAVGSFVAGACVPLVHRLKVGRRASPDSRTTGAHVVLGITTAVIALGHTICILPEMGSPEAVAGGTLAIAPGVLAFFLLFAHVGVGSRLRDRALRTRPKTRRTHLILASAIAVCLIVHIVGLHE
jgi:quinol-cytochrome oxidoreductase complex cytochrome b subunit